MDRSEPCVGWIDVATWKCVECRRKPKGRKKNRIGKREHRGLFTPICPWVRRGRESVPAVCCWGSP